jgi:Zn-dependent protease
MKIKLFTVRGIPLYLHISMLLMPLLILFLSSDTPTLSRFLFSLGAMALMYVFVTIHEYGHSLVAQKFGLKVDQIILHVIGGAAMINGLGGVSPKKELWIAIAGPMVNFILAIPFMLLALIPIDFTRPFFLLCAIFNIAMGLFNLFPALPMDGGRILKSSLELFGVGRLKATRISMYVARILAVGMLIMGIMWRSPGFIIVPVIIWFGSKMELKQAQMGNR